MNRYEVREINGQSDIWVGVVIAGNPELALDLLAQRIGIADYATARDVPWQNARFRLYRLLPDDSRVNEFATDCCSTNF